VRVEARPAGVGMGFRHKADILDVRHGFPIWHPIAVTAITFATFDFGPGLLAAVNTE